MIVPGADIGGSAQKGVLLRAKDCSEHTNASCSNTEQIYPHQSISYTTQKSSSGVLEQMFPFISNGSLNSYTSFQTHSVQLSSHSGYNLSGLKPERGLIFSQSVV